MKRGSLSSLSAGAKGILSGKFGDAFKRFEGNSSGPPGPRTPSPLKDLERRELTPIAGSETMDGRSDDGQVRDLLEDDGEYLTPEMRREKEARMLAQEEARVAAAQAEYRQRLAAGSAAGGGGAGAGVGAGQTPLPKSIGGVSRAVSIQNKVQSLIDESNRSSAGVTRTAQGYGHSADSAHVRSSQAGGGGAGGDGRPPVPRKPGVAQVTGGTSRGAVAGQQQQQQRPAVEPSATGRTTASTAAAAGRPMAPPKPTRLGMNPTAGGGGGGGGGNLAAGGRAGSPPKTQNQNLPLLPANRTAAGLGISVPKIRPAGGVGGSGSVGPDAAGTEALLAVDLPGQGPTLLEMTAAEKDDYISNFQKRYPSLSAIEMVERDLAAEEAQGRR
jgi:AP2-associated kinase